MIEDLIFKGKSLDEALSKASNFFGVEEDSVVYEEIDSGAPGTVAIKLTKNPIMRQSGDADDQRARYGLLRSSTLGKQAPRQYQHPQTSGEEFKPDVSKSGDGRKARQQKPASAGKNTGRNQKKDFLGGKPRNNDRQRGRSGKGRFQRNERRYTPPPQDENWTPTEFDPSSLGEYERKAYEFVTEILGNMGLRAEARPVQEEDKLLMNVDGPDRGLLLNRKGEPLVAIQYLVNKIFLGPGDTGNKPVYVDSRGYRIARDEELYEIAVAGAEKVKLSGREYNLNPMNPYERRQVHIALKDMEEVDTVSRGNGYIKRVSIVPAR